MNRGVARERSRRRKRAERVAEAVDVAFVRVARERGILGARDHRVRRLREQSQRDQRARMRERRQDRVAIGDPRVGDERQRQPRLADEGRTLPVDLRVRAGAGCRSLTSQAGTLLAVGVTVTAIVSGVSATAST